MFFVLFPRLFLVAKSNSVSGFVRRSVTRFSKTANSSKSKKIMDWFDRFCHSSLSTEQSSSFIAVPSVIIYVFCQVESFPWIREPPLVKSVDRANRLILSRIGMHVVSWMRAWFSVYDSWNNMEQYVM